MPIVPRMPSQGWSRIDGVAVSAAIVLLFVAALPWIAELGMEYDEAHFLESATRIVAGHPERPRWGEGLYLFHRPFLFMTMPYVGALDGWLMALPLSLFGFHQSVSRLANLTAGAVALALSYGLARRLGGRTAAILVLALLLVDLEFLLHIPVHFGPFLLQIICGVVVVWLIDRWLAGGPHRLFYGACGAGGLAFQEKLTFVWFLAVYTVALLAFRGRDVWRRLTVARLAAGLIIFLLAMAPVLWYAATFPEQVLGYGRSAAQPSGGWALVAERFRQWHELLGGQEFMRQQLGEPGVGRFSALAALWWGGLALALVGRRQPALLFFLMTLGLILLNALFPDGGRLHHYLLIYPFPQIAVALVAVRNRWTLGAACLLLAATGLSTLQNLVWYRQEVQRTGGHNHWSSAIYDLAEWMKLEPEKRYCTTAWGFYRPLYTLTGGVISIRDRYFEMLPDPLTPELERQAQQLVQRRATYWITSNIMPQYELNLQKLFRVAAGVGLEPRLVKTFSRKTGEKIYEVYSFVPEDHRAWRPLPSPAEASPVVRLELPPGVQDVRFRLPEGHSRAAKVLVVELLDADGQRWCAWWRTLEHYPLVRPHEWLAFGRNLAPDYFEPLPAAAPAPPRYLQVTLESPRGDQRIRPTAIEVR